MIFSKIKDCLQNRRLGLNIRLHWPGERGLKKPPMPKTIDGRELLRKMYKKDGGEA
ncbi:MAG: hypothetical protein PHQ54_05265 [Candidatus Omnitrophica bacterium]|nr:hypothetical protein [Candidatus Omnitrophota bacterium]